MAGVARFLTARYIARHRRLPVSQNHSKPCVLLLCPPDSYRLAAYVRAAESLGIDLVAASKGEFSLIRELAQGLHLDIDRPRQAVDAILHFHRQRPLAGILASDDSTVEIAALAAAELGLPANSPDASRLARRKDLARARLAQHDQPVPRHRLIDLRSDLAAQLRGFPLPAVAKPLGLSASRGVIRADNLQQLQRACQRIAAIIADQADPQERHCLLLEEYIDGFEVAADAVLIGGRLQPVALFDKPDPLVGPFFEETYYITPSRLRQEVQRRIWQCIRQACECYGLQQGPVHAELRIADDGPVLLEIAARTIGGDCARMFDDQLSNSLEELALASAIGRSLPPARTKGARGVLMIPIPRAGVLRRVDGTQRAAVIDGIRQVSITARPGNRLLALPEGASYLGFIFAQADTPEGAERALRAAHAELEIRIDPFWELTNAADTD